MAGENKIYAFAEDAESPFIETDEEYEDDPDRVSGWEPGVVEQPFLNKLHKQAVTPAAGLSQFIADNQDEDVTDALTPAEYAALLQAAIQGLGAVTEPKFDDSEAIATDEFVQNALGNFSNTYTLTTNTTLTGLQAGQFGIIGANGLTINLPACSDVPDGVVIALIGNGFGNTTIQRLGTDVISLGLNGSALSFVTLAPQDSIEFVKSGGVWIAYAGSAYLQGSSAFQHSNTSSGYIKLPGGLIMQWGVATISPNTTATINLATAWGTGMLNGHATFNSSPGGANDISKLIIMPLNSTQIHIAYNNSNAFGNNAAVYYFVIGR